MEVNIPLFVIIILHLCNASVSLEEQVKSCKASETEVTVTPTTLEEIINFFNFHEDITEILNDTLTIETQIIPEAFSKPIAYNKDQDLNIIELITKYGFTPEVHNVTTKDGYELTMHRIIGNGPVVFLMHGLLCSSDEWVTAGPGNSLAYLLASEGYDVWLGNARGNKYSKKHVSLSPECDEFWQFSWDEISLIDLPSMIDYALNISGKSHLTYVGHSQGTTNLLALCSELLEYNEKISLAVLLAPTAYLSHWKSPLFRLISLNPEAIYKFTQLIGLNNPSPVNEAQKHITDFLCGNNVLSKIVCSNIIGFIFGYGRKQLDIANLPVFLSHFPSGASIRQFIHFGQEGRTGKFQKFNFSKERNLEVYGSQEPPEYKPEKVKVPTAIYYAQYDWIANVTDVKQLRNELPNVVSTTFLENYSHVDFFWAKNTGELINKPLVELISKYQK